MTSEQFSEEVKEQKQKIKKNVEQIFFIFSPFWIVVWIRK